MKNINRRDFFKKTLTKALPIIGILSATSLPILGLESNGTDYCPGSCTGLCLGSCSGNCKGECKGSVQEIVQVNAPNNVVALVASNAPLVVAKCVEDLVEVFVKDDVSNYAKMIVQWDAKINVLLLVPVDVKVLAEVDAVQIVMGHVLDLADMVVPADVKMGQFI